MAAFVCVVWIENNSKKNQIVIFLVYSNEEASKQGVRSFIVIMKRTQRFSIVTV